MIVIDSVPCERRFKTEGEDDALKGCEWLTVNRHVRHERGIERVQAVPKESTKYIIAASARFLLKRRIANVKKTGLRL